MDRIKSFQINHNILEPGFYISREDGDIITYDLRTRKNQMQVIICLILPCIQLSICLQHVSEIQKLPIRLYISDLWDVRRDFILWSDRLSRKRYLM